MDIVVPPRICLSTARKTVSFETKSRSTPKPGDVAGCTPPSDGPEEDEGERGSNDLLLAAIPVPLPLRKSLPFRGSSGAALLSLPLSPPPLRLSSSSKRMDGIVGAVDWEPPPRPPPLAPSSSSSSCCCCSSQRQSSTYGGFSCIRARYAVRGFEGFFAGGCMRPLIVCCRFSSPSAVV